MVSAIGLCHALSAGWEHTRPTQHSHCSAVRMNQPQAPHSPTMESIISYPLFCRQEKPKTNHTQNNKTPPKKVEGKKNPNNSRHEVWSCTAQHIHSGMEKKGMFEGCGMTPAPGTAWQWVNRLWLRGCAQKQEGLRISQPARKVLWPQSIAKKNQIIQILSLEIDARVFLLHRTALRKTPLLAPEFVTFHVSFLSASNVHSCIGRWEPTLWLMSNCTAPPLTKLLPATVEGSPCAQMAKIRQVLSSAFT